MKSAIELAPMRWGMRLAVARFELDPSQHGYVPPMRQVLSRARRKESIAEFGILRDGRAVGYFQLNFSRREIAHYCCGADECGLEAMMIHLPMQGRGIGGRALSMLSAMVREEFPDYGFVKLTVNCDNQRGIKAYLGAGFEDTGKLYHGATSGPQHIFRLDVCAGRECGG